MVSPVRGDYRRCQAETPLTLSDLFKFAVRFSLRLNDRRPKPRPRRCQTREASVRVTPLVGEEEASEEQLSTVVEFARLRLSCGGIDATRLALMQRSERLEVQGFAACRTKVQKTTAPKQSLPVDHLLAIAAKEPNGASDIRLDHLFRWAFPAGNELISGPFARANAAAHGSGGRSFFGGVGQENAQAKHRAFGLRDRYYL